MPAFRNYSLTSYTIILMVSRSLISPHVDTSSSEMLRSRGCHLNGGNAFWTQQGLLIPPQEAQQSPNQLRSHTECSQSVHSLRLSFLSPAKNKRLCIDRFEGLGLGLRPSSCKMHIALISSNLRFSLIKPDIGAGDNLRGGVYVVFG